jgi:uncharacterized protein YkwD
VSSRFRRLAAVGTVAVAMLTMLAMLAMLTMLAAAAAPVAEAALSLSAATRPAAHARILSSAPVAVGDVVTVRITHLARTSPVTVTWGDGRTSRRATSCADASARSGAPRCARAATTTFAQPGTYVVRVRQDGRVLAARTITVGTAPTLPSRPAPWASQLLDRVNDLRASVGAEPLALCGSLGRAAQAHAIDMAVRGYFSHTGADGSTVGARVDAQGFDGRTWGENIAAGYASVDAVMDGWIASPGHYANLVRGSFTQVGFGRAESTDRYGVYWVQDFGSGGTC